jgi:hypothetical protein
MIPMTVPTFSAVTSRKFGGGGAVLGWVYRSWRVALEITEGSARWGARGNRTGAAR